MLPDSYTAVHRYDGAIIQRQRCDEPAPCVLRERDLAIVRDVWRYHFLTTNQIRELWWSGKSIQAARRRLVTLFRASYLERFRPHTPRGSYEWTYFLSAGGHRVLRELGVIDPGARFKPRDVFDYGRALHDIQVNAWVLAYRRRLGSELLDWQGEHQITPPRGSQQAQLQLEDHWSVEGLRDPLPRPVVPDATLEIDHDGAQGSRLFLIEYDRTSRTDKNYDKFRR
jgi:Replication-relaxation